LRECARKYGFNSILALPLISDEHLYGILAIHAMEKDAFAEAEIRLLSELADNLAYGIRALRTQAERAMLVAAIEQAAESVFITDERGTIQ
jgi:GAF domain-containing protein